jgi:hypothetical protein
MSVRLESYTPVGRIVAGSVSKPQLLDMSGKPRTKPQYFFALAVRKDDPAINDLLTQIYTFGIQSYSHLPAIQQRAQQWLQPGSQFAWKIDDGDNQKFAGKIGYPGHWVFKFGTTYALRTVDRELKSMAAELIRNGYFAVVAFNIVANGKSDHTAGIFMNPSVVQFVAYGEEILGGAPIEALLPAAIPATLPPGAFMTPMTPAARVAQLTATPVTSLPPGASMTPGLSIGPASPNAVLTPPVPAPGFTTPTGVNASAETASPFNPSVHGFALGGAR